MVYRVRKFISKRLVLKSVSFKKQIFFANQQFSYCSTPDSISTLSPSTPLLKLDPPSSGAVVIFYYVNTSDAHFIFELVSQVIQQFLHL